MDLTGDTATPDKVIIGFTFHDAAGVEQDGTCTFDVDSSGATAKAAEVLSGKTFAAGGHINTGTMPNNGKVTGTITTKDGSFTIPLGYHDGSGAVTIDPDEMEKLIAQNIREGITILGVTGTMTGTEPVTARFGDPYDGIDLTEKFADEIAASPYSGDAWAWIKARIQAGNYTGIHVKDFIPFTTTNGVTLRAEVAGIDTYRNYGNSYVGRHIDFICLELWPTLKPINPVKYNNGLIPVENITLDGVATSYTLTKEMNGVASITKGGEGLTGWHYDSSTFTITFDEAPAAGTAVVTGTGTEHPWLACDLYHWLNSLSGQIPNGTSLNPAVKHVDYTQGGVYFYLPQALKNVIVEKRLYAEKRYSTSGVLSSSNAGGWTDIGKLWFPTEFEVYGAGFWAGATYAQYGSAVQYPIFAGNMNRVKLRSGSRSSWWLLSPNGSSSTDWCNVTPYGNSSSYSASNTSVAAPVCFRVG